MREGLRSIIRTFAPIGLLGYICYKFYLRLKDTPFFKSIVGTYQKLWLKITKKHIK